MYRSRGPAGAQPDLHPTPRPSPPAEDPILIHDL
jgi:hypothetical protein